MAIAWHILNRVANPQDARFSKHVLVIAPGLTVRKRLAVLEPSDPGNYYERFDIHAVTEHGGFGRWTWGVSKSPSDILDVAAAATRA